MCGTGVIHSRYITVTDQENCDCTVVYCDFVFLDRQRLSFCKLIQILMILNFIEILEDFNLGT